MKLIWNVVIISIFSIRSMNFKTTIIALSAAVVLSIASITGFQLTEIIAEETEDAGYEFAEGLKITGVFKFRDGTEVYPFEVFNQETGFKNRETYVFALEKIVGQTPLLHKAADLSYHYRNSPQEQKINYEFDASIVLSNGGDQKRVFDYSRCYVSDYEVSTDFDKEEGWMGKGFAVKDNFEIACSSYEPLNPIYESMNAITEKATAKSSMDYQQSQRSYQ